MNEAKDAFEDSRSWESCSEYSFSCWRRLESRRESAGRWAMSVEVQEISEKHRQPFNRWLTSAHDVTELAVPTVLESVRCAGNVEGKIGGCREKAVMWGMTLGVLFRP